MTHDWLRAGPFLIAAGIVLTIAALAFATKLAGAW